MSCALQTASQGASEGLRAGEFAVMTLIESVGGPWVQMMGIWIQTCPVARRRNANCRFEAPVKTWHEVNCSKNLSPLQGTEHEVKNLL